MILNLAHRGYSDKYPENTLLAFKKAKEAGFDGIELDVQLSRDGEPVIIHDEELKRITGEPGFVWEYTLEELKKMKVMENSGYGVQRIPTLREYFEMIYPSELITNIELKTSWNPYPGIEEKVLSMMDEMDIREKIWISSFNHFSAVRFKRLSPNVKCGLLEESRIVGMAEYAQELHMDFLHPVYYTITEQYAQEARARGLEIHAWTVNDAEEAHRLERMCVQAVIGNRPVFHPGL